MALSDYVKMMNDKVEKADPTKTKGINSIFQFNLSGEDGGIFHVNASDDGVQVEEAPHENPNVTIEMTADDFKAMLEGKLNATSAFMAGKLKVKGDMSLAMKLQTLVG
jgi:putative sterol carrier protein